jgi:hypothetical protein
VQFPEQLQPLTYQLHASANGNPGYVSAGSGKARHEPQCHRVAAAGEDDRNRLRRLHGHLRDHHSAHSRRRIDHRNLSHRQLREDLVRALGAISRSIALELHRTTVRPAKVAEAVNERARVRVLRIGSRQFGIISSAEHVRHHR